MENPGVSSGSVQYGKPENKNSKDDGIDPPPKKPGSKAQGRKRTKTGCLTCRKRRIKCGEERPTCLNCTKSKRQCEGYNQRVVFKDPLSAYRPSLSNAQISYGPISGPPPGRHGEPYSQTASTPNPLPIAPWPSGSSRPAVEAVDTALLSSQPHDSSTGIEHGVSTLPVSSVPAHPNDPSQLSTKEPHFSENKPESIDHSQIPEPNKNHSPRDQPPYYDFNALLHCENRIEPFVPPAQLSPLDWPASQRIGSQQFPHELFHDSKSQFLAEAPFYTPFPANTSWGHAAHFSTQAEQALHIQDNGDVTTQAAMENEQNTQWGFEEASQSQHREPLHIGHPPTKAKVEQVTSQSAQPQSGYRYDMIEDDDGPFDVSDDDVAMEEYNGSGFWQTDPQDDHLKNNDLGFLVALQAGQDQGLRMRSFISWINRADMLATYAPSLHSSPLHDPMTARIFCHFVNVTAPSISMFERHPANPSLMFQGQPVPKSQQHMWTYTFPTLALQNPALLHAMLALASLHIAQLQKEPITASLKHYAISLRRIAKSIGKHTKQKQPATLAAAMLLAFYECWCADHQKWSNHLLGAKHLLRQIDFVGMTRHIKTIKKQQQRAERARYYQAQRHGSAHGFLEDISWFQIYVDDVDENIVSMLMGKKLRYDEYGHIMDDNEPDDEGKMMFTERDLEIYETQRDLYWWYCKQDVYQSILGGGKLFLEYDLWSHCPPRAPLGRLNATYGTYDHLMLLMGRLADFASKDLNRKRIAAKTNGGWRPSPDMMPPVQTPGSQMPEVLRFPPRGPLQIPDFSGMVPNVHAPKLPMGFEEWREASPQSTTSADCDLEAQKVEAEEEWQEIRNMFSVLEDHFGEDFQALGPEFSAPIQTPFGTALQYRTYGIAGIWMNYYMGLIACHRYHPAMPPAAMMAAGVAARQTASLANELGRIAAGLAPDCSMATQVSPGVGASLIESATCLFISGVQYQDAAQRAWTVNRLRDIDRLTGWETAIAIAAGCETSWIKTGEMGKGPLYVRTTEQRVVPDVWTNSRRVDRAFQEVNSGDDKKLLPVGRTDRVHYALGVLGIQEDFENLDLDNDDQPKHT